MKGKPMHSMKHAMGLAEGVLSHDAPKMQMPKKVIHEMKIRRGKSGGHIITHVHKHPMHPDEEHVVANKADLLKHVADHMSEPEPEQPEASGMQGMMPPSGGTQQMASAVGM